MAEQILSPGVFQNESDQSLVTRGPLVVGSAIIGATVSGAPFVPTYVTSYSEYTSKFGDVFKSGSNYYEYYTSLAAKDYFNNGGTSLLVTRVVNNTGSLSTYASSSAAASGSGTSFVLETIAWGDQVNNSGSESTNGILPNGTSYNVRWEVSNVDYTRGIFTLLVRQGDDNSTQKNVLESWTNLSLDPMQSNFISRVIGDKKPFFTTDSDGNPIVDVSGSYDNQSLYVRVKSISNLTVDSIDNNGNFKTGSYSQYLPALGSGSFNGGVVDTNLQKLMGNDITSTNIQGNAPAAYNLAINLLSNKETYQFNVVAAPGLTLSDHSSQVNNLINKVQLRGDAIVVVDPKLYGATITSTVSAAGTVNSNYASTYWPWAEVFSNGLGRSVKVPASTVMLGVYAFNDQVSAEWFAPAGLNRGGIPSVINVERKLSQSDRDTLYTANVNPLATFPGQGVVVYGQKTLQKKATALDRVNVRRLLISLKNYIGQIASQLVFEQNTNATRNRFLSQVNPYLESVVQRQGLYAFRVVMDDSNNTPDVIDRNQLVGSIQIQPTKTAEYIILTFNILPTGVSFE
jgi:hypothetical protein